MFELIEEPLSIPLTLESAYDRQNKILDAIRFIYTAFDGIKLDISNKNNPPVILKGSICMFCYSLFEAKENIILTDNFKESSEKYIILKLSDNGKNLIPEMTQSLICNYNEELGGFYYIDKTDKGENNGIFKYIRCIVTKDGSKYGISYFDIYNNEVY